MSKKLARVLSCPCGLGETLEGCCGQYLGGASVAPTAERLMRSRYTAYTLCHEAYLLATWHTSTRPESLNFTEEPQPKWIGLDVRRAVDQDAAHAIVSFVARYRVNGRAGKLEETSRFVKEEGQWFYVDGDVLESS